MTQSDEYTVQLLADYPKNLDAELTAIRHNVRRNTLTPEQALGKMQEACRLYEMKLSLLTEQYNRRIRREGDISPAVERVQKAIVDCRAKLKQVVKATIEHDAG